MNSSVARDTISLLYGSPLSVVSDCLRGFICAKEGHELIAADLSAIESRMINWLAGQEDALEIYRRDGKVYEANAAFTFGIGLDEVTDYQRQVGKVEELAFGYQGGVGAMQQMAKGYNVKLAPAFDSLWSRAPHDHREKSLAAWEKKKKTAEISREEFIASDLAKHAWRASHPEVVSFWYQLERAALSAIVMPGEKFTAGASHREITYMKRGSWLLCRLPSSRVIVYPYPELKEVMTPWGKPKSTFTYMGVDSLTKKWERQTAYGGLLAENCTQGASRCVLTDRMKDLEARGYPIVLHVHDEAVAEVPKGFGSVQEMESIMTISSSWMKGLPIAAKGWRGKRYRK